MLRFKQEKTGVWSGRAVSVGRAHMRVPCVFQVDAVEPRFPTVCTSAHVSQTRVPRHTNTYMLADLIKKTNKV